MAPMRPLAKALCLLVAAQIPGSAQARRRSDGDSSPRVGFFLRSLNLTDGAVGLNATSKWLEGTTHYRILPGRFPDGMEYHFDGLATVLKLEFANGQLAYSARQFQSKAATEWDKCDFLGTGTGPTHPLSTTVCFRNPGVNLLPIDDQLWLTIDTTKWGQVDPSTLATLNGSTTTPGQTLNAHPACDPQTRECFVQHPCTELPVGKEVCFSRLTTGGPTGIYTTVVANATLSKEKTLQHSHSPCVTRNWLVSKLDSFVARDPLKSHNKGLLKEMRQGSGHEWLVAPRPGSDAAKAAGESAGDARVLTSEQGFVNNHVVSCREQGDSVVVDVVATTSDYLDAYSIDKLAQPAAWGTIFSQPLRCVLPTVPSAGNNVSCKPLLPEEDPTFLFDYPTGNPLHKVDPAPKFAYGIAPNVTKADPWFTSVVKMDLEEQKIVARWNGEGDFVSEAGFIPRPGSSAEDDGVLLTITYRQGAAGSAIKILDAQTLQVIDSYQLPTVVPFHAHGISCMPGKPCYTNP